MAIQIQLGGGPSFGPIEGPAPVWRTGPTTTIGTELAITQTEAMTQRDAMDTDEKLIGVNNLRPISFLAQGLRIADAVALIQVAGRGTATGFLITPDVLMTNNHVLRNAQD